MNDWYFNLEGLHVTGMYMGEFPVSGLVELSHGGGDQHTILLDEPITIDNTIRKRVVLNQGNINRVRSAA